MAVLEIEKGRKNKILRTRSEDIAAKKADKKMKKFFEEMRETMIAANGIGLAAPQVGKNIRTCVCMFNQGTVNELIVDMINPEIVDFSEEMEVAEEGCLSLPGEFGMVARHRYVTVRYNDLKGGRQTLRLKGLNAAVIQHEIDHLDGTLFVDRMEQQALEGQHIL